MVDGYYLQAEGEFYGVTGGGISPSYPSPEVEIIRLLWEGEILATAYHVSGTGRYANTPEPEPSTILYRDWQECLLATALPESTSQADTAISETISEGFGS